MSYTEDKSPSSTTYHRTGKVLLIYTGGTIGMGCNPLTRALEPLDFEHLSKNMPEFKYLNTSIDTYHFSPPVDSSDMTPRMWAHLVRIISMNYNDYDGFVVLHGTDTMAYTASALSFMLENLTKPVILTGSQLPIGQLRTDGKENLVTSIELASAHHPDGRAIVPEVCIYFSGHLLRGNRATKQSADGFNAFATFNYPVLCNAGVEFVYASSNHILSPDFSKPMTPHMEMDTNVIVLSLFPGIQECFLRQRQCPPEDMASPFAQGSECPGGDGGEHQPMHIGACGDGPIRHRVPTEECRCDQWLRQYGRECRHQVDVSPGPLYRPPHHPPTDEPVAVW